METVLQPVAEALVWVLGLLLFLALSAACEGGFRESPAAP